VPEHLSLTGFSDLEIVAQLDPPLSTVRIPTDEIGTRIADFLLDRIAGKTGPKKIELEASVVIRGSTGPARAPAREKTPRRVV
jgi:LacI family transcriptional regulator